MVIQIYSSDLDAAYSDSHNWDHIDSRGQVVLQKFTVNVLILLQSSHKQLLQNHHQKTLWLSEFSRFTADLKSKISTVILSVP